MSYPKQTYSGGAPPTAPPPYNEAVNSGYQQGGDTVPNVMMHSGVSSGMRNMMQGVEAGGDVAAGSNVENAFSDKAVRRGFIRKVYGILSVQLLITGSFIAAFLFSDQLKMFVVKNPSLYLISFVVLIVCMVSMACCESARRKAPTNFILLGIFTLCESFMLATVTIRFDADAVLMAVGLCALVTFGLTLFAFQTKYDFTNCGGMLCGLLLILVGAGFLMIFLPTTKWTMILLGCFGAFVFSLYIIYDTQMIMGGSHKYAHDPEEYIFASLNLYLDIVNLFLYILMIIGGSRE